MRPSIRRAAPVNPDMMGFDDEDPFATIIWFDQGTTTGWAVFCIWPEALTDPDVKILSSIASWSAGEFYGTEPQIVDQMIGLVEVWPDNSFVGLEDFILRKFSMSRELLSPVRVGARFEERMRCEGRQAQLQAPQMPSLAMTKVTDERQKAWGFWLPGLDDARDAIKHCITFASRLKEHNLAEAAR